VQTTYFNVSRAGERSSANWGFVAIFVAGCALRVALLRVHGTQGDLTIFVRWAHWLMQFGTHGLYGHTDSVVRVPINYPPVYALILAGVVAIYQLPILHGVANDALLRMLLKMPAIVADMGLCALAYAVVLRRYGRTAALAAAAIAAFMPSTWPISAIWGQIDSVPAVLMALAIVLAAAHRYTLSWIVLALAVLVKPLPIIIAPLLLLAQLQEEGVSFRVLGGPCCGLLVGYLASLPFAPTAAPFGVFGWLASTFTSGQSLYLVTSENAYNIWTLATNPVSDSRTFLHLSLHVWGWIAFLFAAAPVAFVYYRRNWLATGDGAREHLLYVASFIVLAALFVLATRMHERYVVPALALTPFLWPRRDIALLAAIVLSLTFVLGICVQELDGRLSHGVIDAAIHMLSFGNVICVAALVYRFITWKKDDRDLTAPA
jgi:dolichyl-phosphate-mannose-protein mannosyltransferase